MDEILQNVTAFAKLAHGDQRRKFADEPYINHPVRVMEICKNYTDDITILSAALMHDVLEDTPVSKEEIRKFISHQMDDERTNRTVRLVEELTDIYTKKQYPQWNRRQRRNKEAERLSETSSEAQTIKYADIIDNSLDIHNAEADFAKIYLCECRNLLKVMGRGDSQLYERAIETVQRCIDEQKLS